MLGITDKDVLLAHLIDSATDQVVNFTKQKKDYCEEHLQNTIIELAIIRYNRLGTEGLSAQGFSGVSETFDNTIPENIKVSLYRHRRCY